jgi:hypothetical protein
MTINNESKFLINHAYQTSPISKLALNQVQAYTHKIIDDQSYLLKQNALLWAENIPLTNQANFQAKVLKRIEQDLFYLEKLNNAVSNYGQPGENDLTWSLATNKMTLILNGAREIILDETHLNNLLTGQLPFPEGYDNAPSYIVTCDDTSGLFGNSNLTYLSAAILTVHLELLGENTHLQDIFLDTGETQWIDQAAIAHITPIPESIISNQLDSNFTQHFSYFYSDDRTAQGLAFVHSGYAFGGQRGEDRYGEAGKLYGPEDCSSWIAKVINSDISFSTIDMLYAYRMAQPKSVRGYIDESWLNSDYSKVMNFITPVFISDPIKDIQPGLIWTVRKFDDNVDPHYSMGKSGHTALVLGLEENGDVLTIGYKRNMPDSEGFGLQSFPSSSESNTEVMYFSINQPALSIQDVLTSDNDLFPEIADVRNNTSASTPFLIHATHIMPVIQEEHVVL